MFSFFEPDGKLSGTRFIAVDGYTKSKSEMFAKMRFSVWNVINIEKQVS